MNYRTIGNSGLKTSVLSLGGWRNFGVRLTDTESKQILHRAVDAGVTTFDTADVYGPAEAAMGKALSDLKRSDLVLSTKCYWPGSDNVNDRGLSRKHIRASVDQSLRRLQTDYIDIFLCHRFDAETPLLETIRTFDALIQQGKILYWGSSAWAPEQLQQALDVCDRYQLERPIVEQAEYSLLHPEPQRNGLTDLTESQGIGLMCWSPLAAGLLAGRNLTGIEAQSLLGSVSSGLSSKYHNEPNLQRARTLQTLSREWQVPMATLALNWLLAQRNVCSLVVGVSSLTQLDNNLKAIEFRLSDHQFSLLNELFLPETTQ